MKNLLNTILLFLLALFSVCPLYAAPIRVCVLDFENADTIGQKRFLEQNNKPISIPAQCTLNQEDRKSVNSIMQGFVRMIDAWENSRTGKSNRAVQQEDNQFNRQKNLELYRSVVKGKNRPIVIGAEYLSAFLNSDSATFSVVGKEEVVQAMRKLSAAPDFPQDFRRRLSQISGATHLIYGTVSDIRRMDKVFQGYGIQTKNTIYQLDVIIKMVDLNGSEKSFSGVFTGSYREKMQPSSVEINHNVYETLMKNALQQAAEKLSEVYRGKKGSVKE